MAETSELLARIDRLEDALAAILDEPMVVNILLFQNPNAWTEAVECLSAALDGGPEAGGVE